MKRLIYNYLLDWKNNFIETPLMVIGARQVGKTYIIKKFCEENFEKFVYINLLDRKDIIELFKSSSPLQEICDQLILKLEIKDIEKTIIFFDEVQESEEIISALKFFQEHILNFKIICAGSLLGVKLYRFNSSFPVGKVIIKEMYPMNFQEFLMALGKDDWIEAIINSYSSNRMLSIHDELLKLYKIYLCCGGLPASIKEMLATNLEIINFEGNNIKNIYKSYLADMSKYIFNKMEAVKIETVYNSIPRQLGNESNKFQYNIIEEQKVNKHGKRDFKTAIDWLISSSLIYKNTLITLPQKPLKAFASENNFKLYLNDTGILNYMVGIDYKDILLDEDYMFKGIIAENYVSTQLVFNETPLYYWKSANSAELDFLATIDGSVIPIEVKASDNTKSKSLNIYIEENKPIYSIRISSKNFGLNNKIKSVPLYATFCIGLKKGNYEKNN